MNSKDIEVQEKKKKVVLFSLVFSSPTKRHFHIVLRDEPDDELATLLL